MNTTGKQKDQITPVKRAGKLKAWRQTTLRALLYLNASTCSHSVGLPFLDVVYFITVPVGLTGSRIISQEQRSYVSVIVAISLLQRRFMKLKDKKFTSVKTRQLLQTTLEDEHS